GRERDGLNAAFVAGHLEQRPAAGLPDARRAIAAAGGDGLAARRERDRLDPFLLSLELTQLAAGLDFPESDGAVAAAGEDRRAVGREGDGAHLALMPAELTQFLAGGGVPETHDAVPAAGGDGLAVGRERDRRDG